MKIFCNYYANPSISQEIWLHLRCDLFAKWYFFFSLKRETFYENSNCWDILKHWQQMGISKLSVTHENRASNGWGVCGNAGKMKQIECGITLTSLLTCRISNQTGEKNRTKNSLTLCVFCLCTWNVIEMAPLLMPFDKTYSHIKWNQMKSDFLLLLHCFRLSYLIVSKK